MDNKSTTTQMPSLPEDDAPKQLTPEETRQELQGAIVGSNQILATARTTMTLFPSTVTVDRAKLTVTQRTFMRSADVMSINMQDVLNVEAVVGPFFGTLKITSRVANMKKPYQIGLLKRDDALRVKRIAQGYVIALQRGIDCSTLATPELIKLLDQLGEDNHENT